MEDFWGLKVKEFFRGTKTKVGIFIGTKNIFNPVLFDELEVEKKC